MKETFDFGVLVDLCRRTHEQMQLSAARAADTALATRNWLLGWYIVEYEQNGADRAEYGANVLDNLAQLLGKGFSARSLRQFRAFYRQRREIWQTPSAGLLTGRNAMEGNMIEIWQTVSAKLESKVCLGWSHYVELLTIDSADERKFYEIEAAQNGWGVRELKRQLELAQADLEERRR